MSVARVLLQGTPQYAKNLVGAAFSFPKIFWHFHKKNLALFYQAHLSRYPKGSISLLINFENQRHLLIILLKIWMPPSYVILSGLANNNIVSYPSEYSSCKAIHSYKFLEEKPACQHLFFSRRLLYWGKELIDCSSRRDS